MKVELHLHTSRYSACAITRPTQVMWKLQECGYDAVYLTEHDAVWPDRKIEELRADFPRLRIFPGLERSVGEAGGQHLLVLGTNDPAYLSMTDTPEIILRARDHGHLTVLAHPFRWEGGAAVLDGSLLPDAIEHRTCGHDADSARIARDVAADLGLALVNAGDVHGLQQVDRFWIDTDLDLDLAADIRQIVLDGAYRNHEE